MKSPAAYFRAASCLLVLATATAFSQVPLTLPNGEKPSFAPLLREVTPAVVNISVESTAAPRRSPLFDDPFFDRFFNLPEDAEPVPQRSAGSGVIINADNGYVLTNHHVVQNADKITVTLYDRRSFEGKLIGSDEGTDIALLQIEADDLTAIEFGDADQLEVGDFVLAIGNPYGLGQTVTSGIVSALGRSGLNIEGYEDFIQTDASINPGNSGGALIDLDGKLVGINTAIVSPGGGGNVGIGFAVPVSMAQDVISQLLEFGSVSRGRLGIFIRDVTPELAEALDLETAQGALVTEVEAGSSAERAGVEAGDVVVELNGRPVEGSTDLRNSVGLVRAGSEVKLVVLRDGRRRTITAVVGEQQATAAAPGEGATIDRLAGAEFRDMRSGDPEYGQTEGVLVARLAEGSPAANNGLRQGDVITAVNRRPVTSVAELTSAIEDATNVIALNVLRDGSRLFIVIQ